MKASDLKGLFAIIPTPATPDANKLGALNTVALDETERLVSSLIRDGASGLIILGTTGECATLSNADYRTFVDCICKTVARRIPVFAGATALGGHEVHARLTFVQQQGADGTLLGLPMWQPCTTDMAVKYYSEVAEAFPRLPVMVYANARAFRFAFPTEFWERISTLAPTVIAAKSSHSRNLQANQTATGNRIHFMPPDMIVADFAKLSPATTTACWATAAAMGPEPCVSIIDAVLSGDAERSRFLSDRIAWANKPLETILEDPEVFASYNIQVEKTRIAEAGYCVPGPSRPPYDVFPDKFREPSVECGRRWRELRAELRAPAIAAK
ncbi:dihydrodipicolinate synthase family protein [Roseiarcaceae bacterium H3SJ34-1]|uniref:dihydrodipicolinate synthase family protein n=1 Tax=Terripilifer ovatus TaxID=3032367 RepID=UPI003AB93B43|nr:dihydrodipicolinate synthase family protein [Roseiarcaceae bacterium H3SJ34-1]